MNDNSVLLRLINSDGTVSQEVLCANLEIAERHWGLNHSRFDAEVVRSAKPELPIARMRAKVTS